MRVRYLPRQPILRLAILCNLRLTGPETPAFPHSTLDVMVQADIIEVLLSLQALEGIQHCDTLRPDFRH